MPLRFSVPYRAAIKSMLVGVAAAVSIGLIGNWANPVVCVLALAGGLPFSVLAWRAVTQQALLADRPADPFGSLMQIAFFFVLLGGAWDHRGHHAWTYPGAFETVGFVLIAAGAALRHTASVQLGDQFTVRLAVSEGHRLIATGPYRWIRHPNYAALALIAVGTSIAIRSTTSTVAMVVLWLPSMLLRIRQEERVLEQVMGPAYGEYVSKSWRLCPGIY